MKNLEIKNLNVQIQEDKILHNVSLTVKEGEFLSLLGASGCGKSTLLKSIAGLQDIVSGEICIGEKSLKGIPPESRGTVIVFQDLRLFPNMNVEKNIAFPLWVQKKNKTEQKCVVEKLLKEVQLEGYGKRKVRELSGGQMQRVALARALAAEPKILLLDEPFSGLDEKLRIEMAYMVKQLHEERKITTILVTHDKREALQMSDRIAFMDTGRILQCDTPKMIYYHPSDRTVAEYFGKINYIKGKVKNRYFESELYQGDLDINDGFYEVLVRPSAVKIRNGHRYQVQKIVFMGEMAEVSVQTSQGEIISQMMSFELELLNISQGSLVDIEIEGKYIIQI